VWYAVVLATWDLTGPLHAEMLLLPLLLSVLRCCHCCWCRCAGVNFHPQVV
jgi:hypothetical protein